MTKSLGTVALGFMIVAETCSMSDCKNPGCATDVIASQEVGGILEPGQAKIVFATCSTCDHSILKARWVAFEPGPQVTGSITTTFVPSCGVTFGGITRNTAVFDNNVEIDHNVKNACPDTADWDGRITNNSNTRITLNALTIDCPRKEAEAFGFLKPTGVPKR